MSHLQTLVIPTVIAATQLTAPLRAEEDETPPRAVTSVVPRYPPEMIKAGIEGKVELIIKITDDGTVRTVDVKTSSGRPELDQAATDAVKQWKFTGGGKTRTFIKPVVFRITNDGAIETPKFHWKQLADLNDPRGFAGQFVGVSNGRLLLYGGTNFPDKPVWDGGVKSWYRDVFVLDDLDGQWKKLGPLPGAARAVGYGVSLPYEDGFLCIGGADAEKHVTDCFVLSYDGSEVKTRDLPKLPRPCAYLSGAQVGDVVYVAGGIDKPDAVKTMRTFWALDLKHLDAGWKELEPWPGLPRMLAVTTAHEGAFYLMSGVDLVPDALGKPMRIYHRDAFRYKPGEGWTKLADAPTPIVAAPSPAMVVDGRIAIFGGDEGRLLGFKPMEKHPGFPKTFWTYDIAADAWKDIGVPPFIPVAVPLVQWKDGYVAASGEVRPAVRSREVWYVQRSR